MPRSSYIYLVHPKGSNEPILATFTVKREAHRWVRRSPHHKFSTTEMTRMKDGCDSDFIGTRVLVPWGETDVETKANQEDERPETD